MSILPLVWRDEFQVDFGPRPRARFGDADVEPKVAFGSWWAVWARLAAYWDKLG
jgi:hypothetical protein